MTMYVAPSLSVLLLGRVMYGVGIGFAMHAAPAYIAETCPAQVCAPRRDSYGAACTCLSCLHASGLSL